MLIRIVIDFIPIKTRLTRIANRNSGINSSF